MIQVQVQSSAVAGANIYDAANWINSLRSVEKQDYAQDYMLFLMGNGPEPATGSLTASEVKAIQQRFFVDFGFAVPTATAPAGGSTTAPTTAPVQVQAATDSAMVRWEKWGFGLAVFTDGLSMTMFYVEFRIRLQISVAGHTWKGAD